MGRISISYLLISSFIPLVVTQFQGFFWKNDYLVQPARDGDASEIPVIEGEIEEIQCFVRVDNVTTKYTIIWDYESFNATNTNTSIVGAAGSEHAVSNLTVNIDNPADIDDEYVVCENKKADLIGLQFKVYV